MNWRQLNPFSYIYAARTHAETPGHTRYRITVFKGYRAAPSASGWWVTTEQVGWSRSARRRRNDRSREGPFTWKEARERQDRLSALIVRGEWGDPPPGADVN